jgi:hypothetical protein
MPVGRFDRNTRDSGAIITGVSFSDRAPILTLYAWGSRIDAFTFYSIKSLGINNDYPNHTDNSATTPAVARGITPGLNVKVNYQRLFVCCY